MECYFKYTLKGTKEDITNALDILKAKAETNEAFKLLTARLVGGVKEDFDEYQIDFDMQSSESSRNNSFSFEDMMEALSKMFKDLEITGTGYMVDNPPYPEWLSEKGSTDYTTDYSSLGEPFMVEKAKYINDEGQIIRNIINIKCPECDNSMRVKTSRLLEFYDDLQCCELQLEDDFECEECGVSFMGSVINFLDESEWESYKEEYDYEDDYEEDEDEEYEYEDDEE